MLKVKPVTPKIPETIKNHTVAKGVKYKHNPDGDFEHGLRFGCGFLALMMLIIVFILHTCSLDAQVISQKHCKVNDAYRLDYMTWDDVIYS